MMVDYPVSLPACPLVGGIEDRTVRYVEDSGAVGAPRRRARFTRDLRKWSITMPPFNRTQIEALEDFWDDDLGGGVQAFNFTRPRRTAADATVTVEVRFVKFPAITHIGPDRYSVTYELQEI
jgi:hypothetical protein